MKDQCGNGFGKKSFVEKNRESGKLFRKLIIGGKERRKVCLIANRE